LIAGRFAHAMADEIRMGLRGCAWGETREGGIKHELGRTDLPHSHHAGEDAAELAVLFAKVLASR
jgi:hypothetical protein